LACGACRGAARGVEPSQPLLLKHLGNCRSRSLSMPCTLEKVDFLCLCCYTLCSPQQHRSIRHLFSHREVGGISAPQTTSKANESCRVMHGSTTMATTIQPLLSYQQPAYLPGLTGATASLESVSLLFTSCPDATLTSPVVAFPRLGGKRKSMRLVTI